MRFVCKISLTVTVLIFTIAAAPAVKAEPISIQADGFQLFNLGNDGTGVTDKDTLLGEGSLTDLDLGPGTYDITLNQLNFITGFTGANSGGPHDFFFSQLITINGQTQTLELVGRIDIGHLVDSVHIISATPLVFDFDGYSVVLTVLPTDIDGWGEGEWCGELQARLEIKTNTPVPEPATLTLLGLGLAGVAAKIRQKRRSKLAAAESPGSESSG
jgi:hypothetical protein